MYTYLPATVNISHKVVSFQIPMFILLESHLVDSKESVSTEKYLRFWQRNKIKYAFCGSNRVLLYLSCVSLVCLSSVLEQLQELASQMCMLFLIRR
jgi:hypothetical protein